MLPKGPLGRQQITKLQVYAGPTHPHAAQTPKTLVVAGAKAEIEQEAARAKESLRERVAELAVAGAEKILRREIDAKVHADILLAIEKDL